MKIRYFNQCVLVKTYQCAETTMFSNESLVMLGNESMENQSEAFGEEMICPEISDDQSILLTDFAYWMEGVILLSIGCPGILGMCIAQLGYRGCHASMQEPLITDGRNSCK